MSAIELRESHEGHVAPEVVRNVLEAKTESWPWEVQPYQLWSLVDMIYYQRLPVLIAAVEQIKHLISSYMVETISHCDSKDTKRRLKDWFEQLQQSANELPLSKSLKFQIADLLKQVNEVNDGKQNLDHAIASINQMLKSLAIELGEHGFVCIPREDKAFYVQKEPLFGQAVAASLPDAVPEIQSAGRCYALDEPTACVFHLMRAIEIGLRKLADDLNVTLTDKGQACRVEDADWNKIIEAIKNKIASLRSLPSSANKKEELSRYSDAADRCTYMRDIWRNDISHTGKTYIKSEAKVIIDRVGGFLQSCVEI